MGWSYFLQGEGGSVIDKNNPGQAGQYAGSWHKAGPAQVVATGPSREDKHLLLCVEAVEVGIRGSIEDGLRERYLGKLGDLKRLVFCRSCDPEVFDRIAELDRRMIELEDFREKLERIQEGKDREARIHVRLKSKEEQPKGWRPEINDGVKINIAPWERLGLFPVKKIVGKAEMGE